MALPVSLSSSGLQQVVNNRVDNNNGSNNEPSFHTTPSAVLCPICLGILKEPFMTACGHSFCYTCITKHLQVNAECPSCSQPISLSELYPNFTLDSLARTCLAETNNASRFLGFSDNRTSSDWAFSSINPISLPGPAMPASADLSAQQIDAMISSLLDQRKHLGYGPVGSHSPFQNNESNRSIDQSLVLEFLQRTKNEKQTEWNVISKQLMVLDQDIEKLRLSVGPQRISVNNISSVESNGQQIISSAFDEGTQSVPSRKRVCITTGDQDVSFVESATRDNNATDDLMMTTSVDQPILSRQTNPIIDIQKQRMISHFKEIQNCYFDCRLNSRCSFHPFNSNFDGFMNKISAIQQFAKISLVSSIRSADLFNSSNILSSIDFDRDSEYFATAGVARKIKIYAFSSFLLPGAENHYPVLDITTKNKMSCVCWNSYLKSQLAATDYEGIVSIFDAVTGSYTMSFEEHEKRAWSVDFSHSDPKRLATGSDDSRVKIWNTQQRRSVLTIDSKVNVCSVKFNPNSAYHLAFGSADHNIYYYDLRNHREPLNVFKGHRKAVSYVRWLNASNLVSASTDSSLKLWSINNPSPTCSNSHNHSANPLRTYMSHINEKNFVGLSISPSGNFMCCGSEDNSVHIYSVDLTSSLLTYKFTAINPLTGDDGTDDSPQFVSSVSWSRQPQCADRYIVAANSQGSLRVLEMKQQ